MLMRRSSPKSADILSPPSLVDTRSSSSDSDTDGDLQMATKMGSSGESQASALVSTQQATKKTTNGVTKVTAEVAEGDHRTMMDYVAVAVTVAELPVIMAVDVFSNAVMSSEKRRPFRDTLLDSLMGHCYRSSTLPQLRIMTGVRPLKQELASMLYWCDGTRRKLKNYNAEFHPESPSFSARWVHETPGRTASDPVIIYFHGGGYALKTCQPQVQYICDIARMFRKQRVSVLVLDYTITPFQTYPNQRLQALACLNELQKECNKIILFGDSCGGNLALSILQERSGPSAVDPAKLFGCVLVSPWVDPGAQSGSMASKRDILSRRRLNEMTASYVLKEQLKDPLVTPLRADPKIWPQVLPKNTTCVWGEIECLADQDAEFVRRAGITDYFVERNGTHDCILRGVTPPPCQYITQRLVAWLAEDRKRSGTTSSTSTTSVSSSSESSTSKSLRSGKTASIPDRSDRDEKTIN